jgi:hypothetical protein
MYCRRGLIGSSSAARWSAADAAGHSPSQVSIRPRQPFQPWLGFQGADQLVALARGPRVGALDQPVQVLDEPGAHRGVAGGGLGVVADDESFGARPVVVGAAG